MNARNLLVAAFAGGGVLVAHWLGYRAVAHDDSHAHQLLARTGHGYFSYVIAAVVALTALLMWRYVSHRLEERRGPDVSGVQLLAQAAVRLIPLQLVAFLVLEFGERAVSSGTVINVLGEPAVLMGLLFQALAGIVGAILIAAFAGVIEIIRRRTWTVSGRSRVVRIYPKNHVFKPRTLSLAESGLGLRGPPA